jgi:hypothetical protein
LPLASGVLPLVLPFNVPLLEFPFALPLEAPPSQPSAARADHPGEERLDLGTDLRALRRLGGAVVSRRLGVTMTGPVITRPVRFFRDARFGR